MNKYWLYLIFAACFEVGWVIGLKHAHTPLTYAATAVCIVVSFYALIASGKYLPVGTAYAVFVGLGTAGTITSEMLLFGEAARPLKLILIALLLLGVIGLKILTPAKGGNN